VRVRFFWSDGRPHTSFDEAHRIAFGFSPPDELYFATRLRDGLGERGTRPAGQGPSGSSAPVRVFSGGIEHVYGRGGELRDSPELRAKNQQAERQMREEQRDGPNFDQQRTISVETSRWQTPRSWWNQVPQQPPKSWWSDSN
jgi:hypothetical protein